MARMKQGWIFGLVLVGIFAALTALAAPPVEPPTKVIRFVPEKPGSGVQSGNCWTNSIAASRPDAWRCMIGNGIVDPCFEYSDSKFVVCNPNPAKDDPGFKLELTQPLPKSNLPNQPSTKETEGGWLLELADGTLCRPATGARGVIAGKVISYYCEKGKEGQETSLLDDLTTKEPVWTAEKATLVQGPQGPRLIKSETIAVKTVWR